MSIDLPFKLGLKVALAVYTSVSNEKWLGVVRTVFPMKCIEFSPIHDLNKST